ncbi:acid phosphatase/vanadium-dependent haloperoxidase related protein [Caldalkalibacillus thermarum TA2.A1]|uniref:Acid phosphatase/vanadium-dependent haloperoxidase related protein n=1 Tax=Caldalkalibacillus thermarum (strain TA2.A1) TaxID=986075 RepID=F5L352_CALTT|nr:divergent PAP2 family protein [Caldalkalibacillus thermarum]EGL84233.1 acid phosphatase/vanadium-dependent haloperoxidase related protein [Caldalkalibacillus thermarum TA2.A1]
MEIFSNYPFWAAITAIALAQLIKVPLYYIPNRTLNWGLIFSTGGMPSSHSAAVTSLSTAVAIEHGLESTLFAISAVLALIVMFDAAGVRRHAGEQAVVLNRLVEDVNQLIEEMKNWNMQTKQVKRKKLKELLGHQPIEVLMGGLFGIGVAFLCLFIWDMLAD